MCLSLSLSAVSAFFAQIIGFYLIFMCLAMILQPQRFKKTMTDLMSHPASIFICSTMNILFGLFILVPHNMWVAGWPLLITLIGWLVLLKGIAGFMFPEKYINMAKNLISKTGYQIWAWVWLLIGLYLVWMGLSVSM